MDKNKPWKYKNLEQQKQVLNYKGGIQKLRWSSFDFFAPLPHMDGLIQLINLLFCSQFPTPFSSRSY